MSEIKRTSLQFIYEANSLKENKEIATPLTTITFYDYKKTRISKIPKKFLDTMEFLLAQVLTVKKI